MVLCDANTFLQDNIKDTVTNICNTIINSGTRYNQIRIGFNPISPLMLSRPEMVCDTPFKGDDYTRVSKAIIKTPSLTHLVLYPLSKQLICYFYCIY